MEIQIILEKFYKNKFNLIDEIIYPDHFEYKIKDINYIIDRAKKNDAEIITTEKDFVKISKLDDNKINFVEIDLKIDDEKKLIDFITKKIL